jgi:SAM-dependent methyltransferase
MRTATAPKSRYVLPNAMPVARERLTVLAEIFDPVSHAALERTGVGPGWSCWEAGAGQGGIARWLQARVGPTGRVLATDLDPRFLTPFNAPNLEVRSHDVVAEPPPAEAFDLIHTRLLLCHLAERDAVLARMAGALKPGGWLVVEDFDGLSMAADANVSPDETPLASQAAVRELFRRKGVDVRTGRLLCGKLRSLGLADVQAEGRVFMAQERTVLADFQRLTIRQVEAELLAQGLVSREQIDHDLAALESGFLAPLPVLWSAVGRRA